LGVPGVVYLDALGQQALAPPLPPTGESGTAALCFHPRPEPVLAFPGTLGRLISAFHGETWSPGEERLK